MSDKRYKLEIKALGKRIKQLREESGMIQLDLEIKTGISRSDISKIENGLKNIEFHTIVKIAEGLDIQLSNLFKPDKLK